MGGWGGVRKISFPTRALKKANGLKVYGTQSSLADLERFIHATDDGLPVLVKAGLAHVQFETIHPFLDGNGRLGRLLITLMLCDAGLLRESPASHCEPACRPRPWPPSSGSSQDSASCARSRAANEARSSPMSATWLFCGRARRTHPGRRAHFRPPTTAPLWRCGPSHDEPLVPDDASVIGYIDFSDIRGYEPQIPETATATVPLEMAVWTMGSGCHTGGDTEVAIEGRTAVVTPYDSLDFGAGGCTEELKRFEHKATVVFSDPGIAEIVLRYSTNPSHKGVGRKVYTVEVSPAG